MNFVRTPDAGGPGGKGRYLIAVNSGFGLTFNAKSKAQQTLSVIDLNAKPDPAVIQTVYFPSPQSANFGLVFDPELQPDGKYRLYLLGGFENKIWILGFDPKADQPLSPQNKPDTKFDSPFIDVTAFAENAPSPDYNREVAAVYPTGLAVSPDGDTIYAANNLGDTLGIVSDLRSTRRISRVDLHRASSSQFLYPYDVKLLTRGKAVQKTYVSLWGDGTVAVVGGGQRPKVSHITVGRHPTLMMMDRAESRLYVVNSDDDSVSVIDTATDKVIETIQVRLAEDALNGVSPEGLALSDDEKTLYVANAHANALAIVSLAANPSAKSRSKLLGFIPAGNYTSAVAVVGNKLFIANGKGTEWTIRPSRSTTAAFIRTCPTASFRGTTTRKMVNTAWRSFRARSVSLPFPTKRVSTNIRRPRCEITACSDAKNATYFPAADRRSNTSFTLSARTARTIRSLGTSPPPATGKRRTEKGRLRSLARVTQPNHRMERPKLLRRTHAL